MSVLLAGAMFVLPAVFEEGLPGTAPSAPAAPPSVRGDATPNPTARDQPSRRAVQTYVVRPGDSLRLIAVRIYGDESRWERIYEANRDVLQSPDDLVAGMELEIP
jgi:nucleoid-associated protein YgaU